jgi:hypothetical protein
VAEARLPAKAVSPALSSFEEIDLTNREEHNMQVTLMLDDHLLQRAMQVSGVTTTSEIIERALRVLIGQSIPMSHAVLSSTPRKRPRQPGSLAGHLKIAEDFDNPLPEEMMAAFRGERPAIAEVTEKIQALKQLRGQLAIADNLDTLRQLDLQKLKKLNEECAN